MAILVCGLAFSTSGRAAPPADHPDSSGSYIVVLEDSIDHPAAVARSQVTPRGGRIGFVYRYALKGYSATLSKRAVEALRKDPRVRYVSPNTPGEGDAQTNPTGLTRVFALNNGNLGINEAPDVTIDADIAILDTGIDSTQPDLDVVQSTSCVPPGEEKAEEEKEEFEEKVTEKEEKIECEAGGSTDPNGHGTHVAGTAAAIDNTFGVVGVAPGARLWSVRVLNAQNHTTAARVLAGVNWVTAHASEIEVANMSLSCIPSGGKCSWPTVETAINTSIEKGVVYVLSAGNLALNAEDISPAKNPNAITVGAIADYDGIEGGESKSPPCNLTAYESRWKMEEDDTWANLSNWGPAVDVVAPGVCIYSTLPGSSYGYKTGTSMAAPEVSGAAAVLTALNKPENKAEVTAIRETIEEEGNFEWGAEHEGPQQPLLDVTKF